LRISCGGSRRSTDISVPVAGRVLVKLSARD